MEDIPKIGITGMPHVGKTETLKRIIGFLEEAGYVSQGMITEAILENEDENADSRYDSRVFLRVVWKKSIS